MSTFNQANCSCTRDNVDASCEVHGGASATGQDFGWLDEILYQVFKNGTTYGEDGTAPVIARAAIIEHFTAQLRDRHALSYQQGFQAQAKQHQKELLRARINELTETIKVYNLNDNTPYDYKEIVGRVAVLESRLAKLEGESA